MTNRMSTLAIAAFAVLAVSSAAVAGPRNPVHEAKILGYKVKDLQVHVASRAQTGDADMAICQLRDAVAELRRTLDCPHDLEPIRISMVQVDRLADTFVLIYQRDCRLRESHLIRDLLERVLLHVSRTQLAVDSMLIEHTARQVSPTMAGHGSIPPWFSQPPFPQPPLPPYPADSRGLLPHHGHTSVRDLHSNHESNSLGQSVLTPHLRSDPITYELLRQQELERRSRTAFSPIHGERSTPRVIDAPTPPIGPATPLDVFHASERRASERRAAEIRGTNYPVGPPSLAGPSGSMPRGTIGRAILGALLSEIAK